jgi:transcriptional regulator with XRE-family HTH domain
VSAYGLLPIGNSLIMQFYMKLTTQHRIKLVGEMRSALQQRRWSVSELARRTLVTQSQASRIVAGHFKTYSSSVSTICMELDIQFASLGPSSGSDRDRRRISEKAIAIWDGTPADADKVVALLEEIVRLRDSSRGRRAK